MHHFKSIAFYVFMITLFTHMNSLKYDMIASGCSSYGCKRSCMHPKINPTPGDNGFKIEIEGLTNKKYTPNKTYTGEYFFTVLKKLDVFTLASLISPLVFRSNDTSFCRECQVNNFLDHMATLYMSKFKINHLTLGC
jgi:hypothetical protein